MGIDNLQFGILGKSMEDLVGVVHHLQRGFHAEDEPSADKEDKNGNVMTN